MTMLIDLAVGRACHFCAAHDVRNSRVRRQPEDGGAEELTVPLCSRHQAMLRAAGPGGRLHKPSATRWWYLDADLPAAPLAGCPVSALVPSSGAGERQ